MTGRRYAWLVTYAFFQLLRYDLAHGLLRIKAFRPPRLGPVPEPGTAAEAEHAVCDAVVLACCLYWKPVLCLQRSVCAMRLLRRRGVPAHVVIGYRPVPFFSHAWVEVDGRVVNDSPAYKRRLTVLHTI